jgi:tripartite-type tricarboxylate transporter receptor subunit TctC
MIEAGVPGFDTVTWYGLFLPSATPRPIVTLLNQHVVRVLNDPDVVQRMAEDGAEPRGTTPLQVTQYMKEEAARWKRALKNAPAN